MDLQEPFDTPLKSTANPLHQHKAATNHPATFRPQEPTRHHGNAAPRRSHPSSPPPSSLLEDIQVGIGCFFRALLKEYWYQELGEATLVLGEMSRLSIAFPGTSLLRPKVGLHISNLRVFENALHNRDNGNILPHTIAQLQQI